jgi:peroxin-2
MWSEMQEALQRVRRIYHPHALTDPHPAPGSQLPRRTLVAHGALTLLFPYLRERVRAHALSNAWPDAPSSDRRRKAWDILELLESTHTLFGLLNFVTFLWNGR